jgi:alpha-mannosidase
LKAKLTLQKIQQRLKLVNNLVYRRRVELAPFSYQALEKPETNLFHLPNNTQNEIILPNSYWGEWHRNFILRCHICLPSDWQTIYPSALYLPIGTVDDSGYPEALVYIDQVPQSACDRYHQEIQLPHSCLDGKLHSLTLHGWTGMQSWDSSDPGMRLFMRPCEIVQIDQPTREFVATSRVVLDVANNIDNNHPAFHDLLEALDESFNLLNLLEPFGEGFYSSIPVAHARLHSGIRGAGASLGAEICAIGQSHIDLAWLWTLTQTRHKAGRSFYTVLNLMEQFPEYIFTQSQPQLYEYIQQDYPELFTAIQRQVNDGRWEILGGMWVEADCNMSGAEPLVRQLLLGRTYYQEHFGLESESPVLWLPDSFGFPWSLPQLIAQAGIRYFHTIKMAWNDTNCMPYDSFWWQGLDGTKILSHFASNECNVFLSPENVIKAWEKYPQKETHNEIAILYGWGDGGGGPTREMLENLRELENFPAVPHVRPGRIIDFFERLENKGIGNLPCWNGELYLEKHRGVYTTHAEIKRANRKSEFLLHNAEFLASTASLLDPDYEYPTDVLRQNWKLICLNQFHDILPGSSISEVYTDAKQDYAKIEQSGLEICQGALSSISAKISGDWLIANPIGFNRSDLAFLTDQLADGHSLKHQDGKPVFIQATPEGTLIAAGELPPYSITPLYETIGLPAQPKTSLFATTSSLENDFLRVEFNSYGEVTRIFDKSNGREVLAVKQVGNQLQAFEDRPVDSDAWDIDSFYEDKPLALGGNVSITVIENGPLRAMVEIQRKILHSEIIQRISLTFNSSRLDFDTFVDWHERHVLLKVAFPVEILAPFATYEIQWGSIQRSTHRNTSWDQARFEVCGHKWVDLSEGGYGVSLLNDCKYGHDIHDNVLRISLLRGSTSPDPQADLGEHHFVYSLLPHAGGWESETSAQAYALNDQIVCYRSQEKKRRSHDSPLSSLIVCDSPNVIIETIKAADDGNGLIVRLFESHRKRGVILLKVGFQLAQSWRTNLLEQNQTPVENKDHFIELQINPFEIITLRLIAETSI